MCPAADRRRIDVRTAHLRQHFAAKLWAVDIGV